MLREQIRQSDEFQKTASKQKDESKAAAKSADHRQADTLGDALAPVLDLEKTDAVFWAQILQVIILLAILRELRKGGN